MSDDNFGPWIEHNSGECPIPDAKEWAFELRFRDGKETLSAMAANRWIWANGEQCGADIIAYRVRLPEPDLLQQAIEALRLYDAFIAMPVDRGGQKCPNRQAFKKFVDAKNAVLAAYDAKGGAA